MNSKKNLLISLALTTGAASCFAQSAWLPARNELKVTAGFTWQTFDKFWAGPGGRNEVNVLKDNDESLDQYTGFIALEYGILENVAADATIGYSATTDTKTFGSGDNGL